MIAVKLRQRVARFFWRPSTRPVPEVAPALGSEPQGDAGHSAISGNAGIGAVQGLRSILLKKGSEAIGSGKCPYCGSKEFVKRGTRQKKKERVQLYICRSCRRTFTQFPAKGKSYSLPVIIDAISYYNLGFSFEQVSQVLKKKQGVDIQPSSVFDWYEQYKGMCSYSRMRPFAAKEFSPYNVIEITTLAHRQLYRFCFHRAKAKLIINETFRHFHLSPIVDFLKMVTGECPHQYFQEGLRASEAPLFFSKKEMIVRSKENYATKMAEFVLPASPDNKKRHETLQKFMISNDSVTVATEVPVYLTREDLAHMQTKLGFEIYIKEKKHPASGSAAEALAKEAVDPALGSEPQGDAEKQGTAPQSAGNAGSGAMHLAAEAELPKLITGHVDFIQIRNGSIHLLDYKPNAAKEKPIEQLTLYALALSRLTGLRLFEFKCAWFDEKNYFEFYPLHVVYKKKKGNRKKIYTKEGVYDINERMDKVERMKTIEV